MWIQKHSYKGKNGVCSLWEHTVIGIWTVKSGFYESGKLTELKCVSKEQATSIYGRTIEKMDEDYAQA